MEMIVYDGVEYDNFDVEQAGTEELREIKRKLGMSVRQFLNGINDVDVDAMTAVRWMLLRRNNPGKLLNPAEKFDYWEFTNAYLASRQAAAGDDAEEEPDPTEGSSGPKIPESAGSLTPTSASSPPSTPPPLPAGSLSANGKSAGSLSAASSAM